MTFIGNTVHMVMLMGPKANPIKGSVSAGLIDPTITVRSGARVSIEVVQADPDMAHGLDISTRSASTLMPMMTAAPAFSGSALWFLGNPTAAGMHTGTVAFTAGKTGTYRYLCPVPDHTREGMIGSFVVN